ncbi:MAG: hypothetical protein MIO93_01690 [ANME-2 cluster archaeon]|nr:hypothetical protein [ANME-2 cluster archaeon]
MIFLYESKFESCRPVEEYFNIQGIFRRKFNVEDIVREITSIQSKRDRNAGHFLL